MSKLIITLLLLASPAWAKPTGPVSATASVSGVILAETWTLVEFTLKSRKAVTHLNVAARGIDGVVVSDTRPQDLGSLAPGSVAHFRVRVKISSSTNGFAVLDLQWEADGNVSRSSLPFPYRSRSVDRERREEKPIERSEDGMVYKVMPTDSND